MNLPPWNTGTFAPTTAAISIREQDLLEAADAVYAELKSVAETCRERGGEFLDAFTPESIQLVLDRYHRERTGRDATPEGVR